MKNGPASLMLSKLHPRAQHLGNAPRLCDAAALRIRGLCVEHFADRAHAPIVEAGHEALERMARAGEVVGINLQPRVDEWADEPAPGGALVIRRVARPE